MRRKTQFYYVIIVLSILSIIYPVLVYFGFLRLLMLRMKDVNSYQRQYLSLSKADENNKVVIFICVANDGDASHLTLKSLLDQSVRVDEINFLCQANVNKKVPEDLKYVSYFCMRGNDESLPSLIKEAKKRPREKNCRILLVENGRIYGKDFVEKMVDGFNSLQSSSKDDSKELSSLLFGWKGLKHGVICNIDNTNDESISTTLVPSYQDVV